MIFASDLDQTLIYSRNFLSKHYANPAETIENDLRIIEYYQGEPLSYIHNDVVEHLQKLDSLGLFVPVTTRTEEQYKRIDFGKMGIKPQYAITTNGAKVLKDGKVDKNWEALIHTKLKQVSPQAEEISDLIHASIRKEVIKKIRVAENTFTYCVLFRELLQDDELQALSVSFAKEEWSISLQGTKLYFMPSVISKANAMGYVCQQLNLDHYIAAGDSLLDMPLLMEAKQGIIPEHGEIYDQQLHLKHALISSQQKGINASLAIIKHAIEAIK